MAKRGCAAPLVQGLCAAREPRYLHRCAVSCESAPGTVGAAAPLPTATDPRGFAAKTVVCVCVHVCVRVCSAGRWGGCECGCG